MQERSAWVAVGLTGILVLAVGACALEGFDSPEESEATRDVTVVVRPCGGEQCGENSPIVDVFKFHDASLKGIANNIGLVIETSNGRGQIIKGLTSYDLKVVDAHIYGIRGNTVISGTQLIGARIPIKQGKGRYNIYIRDAREIPYFVGAPDTVGTYKLELVVGDGGIRELCNNRRLLERHIAEQAGHDEEYVENELMRMRTWETVVFEGDRIDSLTKTMSRDAQTDDSWINFGCAGHALAKLLLTRNTYHSQQAGTWRAWEQRQSTLKMLVADYCGGGDPFTVAGQKVVWRGDLMTFYREAIELEARWYEKGALCLNVPRLMHPSSAIGAATFPDIRSSILATCKAPAPPPPPPCRISDPYRDDGGYRVTGNPQW